MLSIIAVIGKNREIGKDNGLIWHLSGDLKRFRTITNGHPVVMGRKTFQSIGRPLPNRSNFVITRDPLFKSEGIMAVSSLEEAIEKAKSAPGSEEIFIIGGGSVYAQAIDTADRLYLTIVDAAAPDADAFFPDYPQFTNVIEESGHEEQGISYTYRTLEK